MVFYGRASTSDACLTRRVALFQQQGMISNKILLRFLGLDIQAAVFANKPAIWSSFQYGQNCC